MIHNMVNICLMIVNGRIVPAALHIFSEGLGEFNHQPVVLADICGEPETQVIETYRR